MLRMLTYAPSQRIRGFTCTNALSLSQPLATRETRRGKPPMPSATTPRRIGWAAADNIRIPKAICIYPDLTLKGPL